MSHALIIDACVLMSGVLRPLLLQLATDDWFEPIWSDHIGSEWQRNASRVWGIEKPTLALAWQNMQLAHPRANMSRPDNSPPTWTPATLVYSDPKDWHVIQTASQARCLYDQATIVTWNLKDFKRAELRRLGVDLTDPDRLLLQWFQTDSTHLERRLMQTIETLIDEGRRYEQPVYEMLARERLFRFRRQLFQGPVTGKA